MEFQLLLTAESVFFPLATVFFGPLGPTGNMLSPRPAARERPASGLAWMLCVGPAGGCPGAEANGARPGNQLRLVGRSRHR